MFFSANQFYAAFTRDPSSVRTSINRILGRTEQTQWGGNTYDHRQPITYKDACVALRYAKQQIANRAVTDAVNIKGERSDLGLCKWVRPWHIVPELMNYTAPVGDYGIGVEVEMAFASPEAAVQVAHHIKDWKYVALDFEGGRNPIEATFAPTKYSTFGSRSQVVRYLDYLAANASLCIGHNAAHVMTGTHVNVSKGGIGRYNGERLEQINNVMRYLPLELQTKYFGRRPYGYGNVRGLTNHQWIEFKLFKSTLDSKVLRRYVDVAVAIVDLLTTSQGPITQEHVVDALEHGYNKRARGKKAATAAAQSVTAPSLSLAA